ncbi:MAG TPA: hypothetical protein VFC17_03850 [Candidatus Limnocylindrales bacterium]|nr:hypothetical protein [Candidatus Limnocylindrales bacterium]
MGFKTGLPQRRRRGRKQPTVKPWVSTPKPIQPRPVFVSLRRGKPGRKNFPTVIFCRLIRDLNFLNDQPTVSPQAFVRHSVTENRHIPI